MMSHSGHREPGGAQIGSRGGRGRPRAHPNGFTLVESLIALIMVGIIGMAFVSLMMGQDRFYGRMDDGIAAEQSLRIAADLAGAELRMGAPENLLVAAPESVSIRFDVFKAVVCDVAGSNTVHMFVYDVVPNAGLPTNFVGTAYQAPYTTTFEFADGWAGTSATSATAKATCVANAAPDTTATSLYRAVSGWIGNFPSGLPQRGAIVRRYGRLSYRLAPSTFGRGYGLYRGQQELVGPLDPTSGFQYVMADSSVQTSVLASDLPDVRIIRVNAIAIGDDPRFTVRRIIAFDIPLRN